MIKREICEYSVRVNGGEASVRRAPFSVYSALAEGGLSEGEIEKISGEATFSAQLGAVPHGEESVFVRVFDIPAGAEVRLNGESLLCASVARREATLNVSSALSAEKNTLEITVRGNIPEAGVFRPAELIKTAYAVIDGIFVTERHEEGKTVLGIRVDTLGASDSVRAVATLVSGAGQIYYGGLTGGKGSITVNDPLYWWPRGLGVQNLYKLTVNLYGEMEIEDTREIRLGLRNLTTAKSADGSLLEVNGVSFVPMGATYHTPKRHRPELSDKVLEAEIATAARSGLNTLVIPADSAFPDERFFELCDAYGIVAVRECADIDGEAALLSYSSYHPSVGIVDIVGAGDSIDVAAEKLHEINSGFEFSSEERMVEYFGARSLPTYKTIISSVSPGQRNLFSEEVEAGADGDVTDLLSAVKSEYLYPSSLSDFAYATQLVSADLAAERIASARRSRGEGGRAVISTLSDGERLVSDSLLDSHYRPKAAAYKASGLFSPVAVFAQAEGLTACFTASNESRKPFIGVLEYRIADKYNRTVHRAEESCVIESSQSKRLFTRDLSEWVSGHEREYYLEYSLREGSLAVSGGTLLFTPAKRFDFADPKITAHIAGADRRFTVTLSAAAYARYVELDFENTDAIFHENYIDITTCSPIKISFTVTTSVTTAEHLMSELKIRSVYDIGSK